MKLLSLTLRNFKGCRELVIQPNGADIDIYGDNAAGKTTIADAWFWLLFGKDSHNSADFEIKTLTPDGKPIHNLEHSVRAVLELPGGNTLELERTFKENWVKKRGSTSSEFEGHVSEYRINTVPVQARDYNARIAELATDEQFRILTDPTYFAGVLDWKKRRKALVEMAGGLTDDEIIALTPELADLPSFMGGHTPDDLRKILEGRRKETVRAIEEIPARIDEAKRSIPSELPAKVDIDPLRAELRSAQERRAQAGSGGTIADLDIEIKKLEAARLQKITELKASESTDFDDLASKAKAAGAAVVAKSQEAARVKGELEICERTMVEISASVDRLRKEALEIIARKFEEPTIEDACAACGHPLPAYQTQAALDKALKAFNDRRAMDLEIKQNHGRAEVERQKTLETKIEAKRSDLDRLNSELAELNASADAANLALASATKPREDWSDHPEVDAIAAESASLIARREEARLNVASELAKIDAEIAAIQNRISAAEQASAAHAQAARAESRITELESEHRNLVAKSEEIQKGLYLLEQFTRAKVRLLTDRINSRFRQVRFQLFESQINGGIAECCEATVNGVPFGSLNHGARINAGLEIIEILSGHVGFAPPIFIDNAESITRLQPTTGQQVRLIVSASDPSLRIETQKELVKA